MKRMQTDTEKSHEDPQRIVRDLLERPVTPARRDPSPLVAGRVATLERQAPDVVAAARDLGLEIEYLGINPLFAEPRLYGGVDTDWVLAPAGKRDDAVVPPRERRILETLHAGGQEFPVIYIAHETERDKTAQALPKDGQGHTVLNRSEAEELVGPVPPPAASMALGQRLALRSVQVGNAVGRAAKVAGAVSLGIAAAPVVLVGGALAGLATIDPIVLGAIPAVSAASGEPAAFYVLARWDW
jgi:hypothetical protein